MSLNFLQSFRFEPIGFIESCYKDKFGVPRQSGLVKEADAKLSLRADLHPEEALKGLEQFSHLWLIFVFHQNKSARYHAKVHPPRLKGQNMGLFATRTPHRPNPIGLSLVELVKVEKNVLHLKGIDLVDQTPILDIKPYMPVLEAKPAAQAGWTNSVEEEPIHVEFTPDAEKALQDWQERSSRPQLRDIIIESIKLDPRPLVYRGYEGQETQYRDEHAFRLHEGDIHFKFMSPNQVKVFKILSINNELP